MNNLLKKDSKAIPPVAFKIPKELVIHDHRRIDNYYWLNERENPEVINYLNDENEYVRQMMSHTTALQERLYAEIRQKIKEEDSSAPYPDNGYYYYTRTIEGKEYYISCRKKSLQDAEEEVLLDVNQLAESFTYYDIGGSSVSPDNKILAYAVDTVSRRNYTIIFKNLQTGAFLSDEIPMTTGRIVWGNDNKTVFYVLRNPETLRSERIMRHTLGTPVASDAEVYFESDETFSVFIYKTKSGKFMIIGSESTLTSEAHYLYADNPTGAIHLIQPRIKGMEYAVIHHGDYFYIRTNLEAQNFRLMRTPVENPGVAQWEEIIPNRKDTFLSGFDIFRDYLVMTERRDGLNHLHIKPWDGSESHYVEFAEEVFSVNLSVNREYHSEWLRFTYSSLTTPTTVFDYHIRTSEKKLLKQQEIPGDFNAEDYETRRDFALASDGTPIPLSLVYRKGFKKDGSQPALLYGYGSYGITIDPMFRISILPLLDRGFVFVIAHIRGEQFYGRRWYDEGKMLHKMNSFTDFITAAEYLIGQQYTNPQKLFTKGGSAGGLLVGAVSNMRPELFKGIIAHVPFVDVLTTMLDESIPLTTGEFDEWGNPKDPVQYNYMLQYSPYDNVENKDYPAMLVTTGFHDSQVQYWEPAKWVAKLRELKTDDNLLLFKTQMDYGHGGASGRFQWIIDLALEYAFILDQLDIKENAVKVLKTT